jgi:hypothetical protein
MTDISSKNLIKNLNRCRIRTFKCLIKSKNVILKKMAVHSLLSRVAVVITLVQHHEVQRVSGWQACLLIL